MGVLFSQRFVCLFVGKVKGRFSSNLGYKSKYTMDQRRADETLEVLQNTLPIFSHIHREHSSHLNVTVKKINYDAA